MTEAAALGCVRYTFHTWLHCWWCARLIWKPTDSEKVEPTQPLVKWAGTHPTLGSFLLSLAFPHIRCTILTNYSAKACDKTLSRLVEASRINRIPNRQFIVHHTATHGSANEVVLLHYSLPSPAITVHPHASKTKTLQMTDQVQIRVPPTPEEQRQVTYFPEESISGRILL